MGLKKKWIQKISKTRSSVSAKLLLQKYSFYLWVMISKKRVKYVNTSKHLSLWAQGVLNNNNKKYLMDRKELLARAF